MKTLFSVLVVVACAGCGNNLAGPAGTSSLLPPGGLVALSVDSAHVRLSWTAPSVATDSTFAGYVVAWGTVADTLPKSSSGFTAGPLARGATTFQVRSLLKGGQASDAAAITWAPAWRFDASPITVTEFNSAQQTGSPGVDVGTATSDPQSVGLLDATADSTLDFYLSGPAGSPLHLVTAALYNPGWHQTWFSTVSTPSPDLNAPIGAFPQDNTFTLQTVTPADNTIYYVRAAGNTGQVNYARIHVHLVPGGAYPGRQVEIRISLQRVSRLAYA
jgi:hypothetical protein